MKQNLLAIKERARVNIASVDNPTQQVQQMQQLQGAVKGLTKLLQNKSTNPISFHKSLNLYLKTGPKGTQENVIPSPQATNGQGSTTPQRGRGGRGGYKGRGGRGRGRGGLMLCYWCRDFLPKRTSKS